MKKSNRLSESASFLVMLTSLSFWSCTGEVDTGSFERTIHEEYIKNNVALVDVRVRSISSTDYVREFVFFDLSKEQSAPGEIEVKGVMVFDNGLEYDERAGW